MTHALVASPDRACHQRCSPNAAGMNGSAAPPAAKQQQQQADRLYVQTSVTKSCYGSHAACFVTDFRSDPCLCLSLVRTHGYSPFRRNNASRPGDGSHSSGREATDGLVAPSTAPADVAGKSKSNGNSTLQSSKTAARGPQPSIQQQREQALARIASRIVRGASSSEAAALVALAAAGSGDSAGSGASGAARGGAAASLYLASAATPELLARPPLDASSVEVTTAGGRYFVRFDDAAFNSTGFADDDRRSARAAAPASRSISGPVLLERPIKEMIAKINREDLAAAVKSMNATRDTLAAARAAVAAARGAGAAPADDAVDEEDEDLLMLSPVTGPKHKARQPGGPARAAAAADDNEDDDALDAVESTRHGAAPALWVDKYAPRTFADLLSSEQVNRNVLRWIKLWDDRVFGKRGAGAGAGLAPPRRLRDGVLSFGAAASADSAAAAHATGSKRGIATVGGAERGAKRVRNANGMATSGGLGAADDSDADELAGGGGAEDDDGAGKPQRRTVKWSGAPKGKPGHTAAAAAGGGGAGGDEVDALWRKFGYGWKPDAKVLLLCGPPGMGKTTLAHIVARHAGYRTVEINASDDRSGKSIRERISSAQAMKSVFGDGKPTCVVLDEVDGMEGGETGGIGELIKMIKATPSLLPARENGHAGAAGAGTGRRGAEADGGDGDDGGDDSDGGGEDAAGTGGGRRRRGAGGLQRRRGAAAAAAGGGEDVAVQPLTRPLICICNDQYAPVLRDLRPLVQIVEFSKTSTERLLSRLKHICRSENLAVTPDALRTLVSIADNDIRGCLNTLQFIRAHADRATGLGNNAPGAGGPRAPGQPMAPSTSELDRRWRVTSDVIVRAAVGSKDQTRALHDVWSAIFKQPDSRGRPVVSLDSSEPYGSTAATSARAATAYYDDDADAGTGSPGARSGPTAQLLAGHGAGRAAAAARVAYLEDLRSQMSAYSSEPRLLLAGLFENAHAARVSDPTMTHACAALDWLCYGEELVHKTNCTQLHTLLKFLPTAGIGVHVHLASDLRMKIAWPRSDGAMRSQRDQRRNIVQSFMLARATAAGGSSAALDARGTVLDLLSPLLSIVSPPLRPVNFGLLNSREKREAQALVDVSVFVVSSRCCLPIEKFAAHVYDTIAACRPTCAALPCSVTASCRNSN